MAQCSFDKLKLAGDKKKSALAQLQTPDLVRPVAHGVLGSVEPGHTTRQSSEFSPFLKH